MLDLALRLDSAGRCDLVYEGGDLVLDRTPATAMLVSLGTDRRAEADDDLPDGSTEASIALSGRFNPRRGWAGDALDAEGRRIGGRLWLLDRAKRTEETRQRAVTYAEQALAWLSDEHGMAVEVTGGWSPSGTLMLRARVGSATLVLPA